MYKDGNAIKIDELFTINTDDKNGLEVMIYIKSGDLNAFVRGVKSQLLFFENVYFYINDIPVFKAYEDNFNNLKIKKYNNFLVNSIRFDAAPTICLGKIQYPINFSNLNLDSSFYRFPISINFEIGDLEVTPNREEILYSNKNIERITNKLNAAREEIIELALDTKPEDYDDLLEYLDNYHNSSYLKLYEDTNVNSAVSINLRDIKSEKLKDITKLYKGESYSEEFRKFMNYFLDSKMPRVTCNIQSNILKIKKFYTPDLITFFKNSRKLLICDYSSLNNTSKNYLRSNFNNTYVVKPFKNNKDFLSFFYKYIKTNNYLISNFKKFTKKEKLTILEFLIKRLSEFETFSNASVPQEYIDEQKALKKGSKNTTGINWKEEINIYHIRESHVYNPPLDVTAKSSRYELEYLKKDKYFNSKIVVYSVKDDYKLRLMASLFIKKKFKNHIFIEIAPTKVKILKEHFPNFVHINDFMNVKYKKIRQIATAYYIINEMPEIHHLFYQRDCIRHISKNVAEALTTIKKYVVEYHDNERITETLKEELLELCKEHNYFDIDVMGLYNEYKERFEKLKFLTLFSSTQGSQYNFFTDYVISKKLFKPDMTAYESLKNETILNLKQKDETN